MIRPTTWALCLLRAFSRLGYHDRKALDALAWGKARERTLFEYWAHEASLLAFDFHPLFRWRMAQADRGEAMALLERIRIDGPMAVSDFESHKGQTGWWEWSDTKRALEWPS